MGLPSARTLALVAGLAALIVAAGAAYYLFLSPRGGIEASGLQANYTGAVVGVFGELRNRGGVEVCIVGVEVAEPVEGLKAEIHMSVREGGAYKMIPVTEPLCIPPGGSLELRPGPGGYHIMVMREKGAPEDALERLVEDGYVEVAVVLDSGERVVPKAPVGGPPR